MSRVGPFSYRFRLLERERYVLLHDAPGVDGHAGVVRHGLEQGCQMWMSVYTLSPLILPDTGKRLIDTSGNPD